MFARDGLSRTRNQGRLWAIGATAIAGVLLPPATASAGTVSATTTGTTVAGMTGKLAFDGAAGESNQVTVAFIGEAGEERSFRVVDAGAPLTATGSCTGGGPPGTEAVCTLPKPKPPSGCIHAFCTNAGTTNVAQINLGDGDDVLDATASGLSPSTVGDTGNDTIRTGDGFDYIVPGEGADAVHAGAGSDILVASTASADGADLLDGGEGFDQARYTPSTSPLTLSRNGIADDGTAGEGDNLISTEWITGGSGDDKLIGADQPADAPLSAGAYSERLTGGPGDDSVLGNGGIDDLEGDGFLEPGAGDDRIDGGPGPDVIDGGGGADRLEGGSADDTFYGRGGDDVVSGDAGEDIMYGDRGDDLARGGSGDDFITGDQGEDRLFAGGGDDVLDGGHKASKGADLLSCGSGEDKAHADPTDRLRACEREVEAG